MISRMEVSDYDALIFDLMQRSEAGDYGAQVILNGLAHYSHKYVQDHQVIRDDLSKYKRHKWLQNWIHTAIQQQYTNRRLAMQARS